jgi:hypothetical protein
MPGAVSSFPTTRTLLSVLLAESVAAVGDWFEPDGSVFVVESIEGTSM